MRLSQTPRDISDHQRRVADPRRINLGVGAAWMSGSLEPRVWPGENRWSFGAPVTPQMGAVGQQAGGRYTWERNPATTSPSPFFRGGPSGAAQEEPSSRGQLKALSLNDKFQRLVLLYQQGKIRGGPIAFVYRVMEALKVDRKTANELYDAFRHVLVVQTPSVVPTPRDYDADDGPTTRTTPARRSPFYVGPTVVPTKTTKPSTKTTVDATAFLARIVKDYQAGKFRTTDAVIARMMSPAPKGLGVTRNTARALYERIRLQLVVKTTPVAPTKTTPSRSPFYVGPTVVPKKTTPFVPKKTTTTTTRRSLFPIYPEDRFEGPTVPDDRFVGPTVAPTTPAPLIPGKTSGGRTTIQKRRTGEATNSKDARLTAGWSVRNTGAYPAKTLLRLRLGTSQTLATTVPATVPAGSTKHLQLWWSVPGDMRVGTHQLSLDIEEIWRGGGGVSNQKLVATHPVALEVVKR